MIICCKNVIFDGETLDDKLWDHERFLLDKLILFLKMYIELNKVVQNQYEITKKSL